MMNSTAPKTEETMTDIAKTVGLDVDQLKKMPPAKTLPMN